MAARRIAFYAPLKAPNHPTPSGDRRMARLLIRALEAAGGTVEVASDFRAYDGQGDRQRQEALRSEGAARAEGLIAQYQGRDPASRPTAWFTYHLYHKAPDWLGPKVAAALNIPYLVAEASFAPKRAGGPWDLAHQAAGAAITAADWVFCLTRLDMACVQPLVPPAHKLTFLPPFLDPDPFANGQPNRAALARRFALNPDRRWLLTVAMMRPGDKLHSYQRLGAALARLNRNDWQLLVVGDGSARDQVHAALAPIMENVIFAEVLPLDDLPDIYRACDIYVWPGVGEAYGMAYLEAQAAGLPVVAGDERGVPDVVRDGETGLLTPPGDDGAFADAVAQVLDDGDLRRRLSAGAGAFVAGERTVAAAAKILSPALP
ncbi:MAG: glycosyltransferase family 4 protein [Rhodospirillaceae bacterium]|jgi:glycosyltransferase involved in cell wall biosynthesis|nr:glycosyltransferase family 4 protein [Rhodospirillaceae bacterium]MBT4489227.1 glycosyltransferase family 4 protein [Rhodospirillaceae bacterium]MBT5194236.1 glycosyltransferase family 4 protein [Rhodospirillaceae bacterium]MBT5897654.1 glycosyltransferase family 4 protein [Rhodospirillaceae bacterium]MBT6430252.1 glycosyltransferase family 4 protein [Rhodospirillaceae bacterium]